MFTPLRTALAVTLAIAATATATQAFELKGGGAVKLKPTKAQLGIIAPDNGVCPGAAKLTAWVFTNKPGTVNILLVKKSGEVSGPYPVTTVKGSNGVVLGSYTQGMMIHNPIDSEYRVVVAGTSVGSNWVPLTACR